LNDLTPPPADDSGSALKPPQFTLRMLLVAITLAGALFAVLAAIGAVWSVAILFLLTLIAAHVLGNSVGTRLRDNSPRTPWVGPAETSHRPVADFATTPRRLAQRNRLHWITAVIATSGALAGGYFGGSALAASYPTASSAAHTLGYVSSGVLGGFLGFVVSSFVSVARQAWHDAQSGSDTSGPRKRGAHGGEQPGKPSASG